MKKFVVVVLSLVLLISFSACSSSPKGKRGLSNDDFAKALSAYRADTVYSRSMNKPVGASSKNGGEKLVLVSYKIDKADEESHYAICLADYDNYKIQVFDYGNFPPLVILKNEFIDDFPISYQQENLDIIEDLISQYDFNCFDDYECVSRYIEILTNKEKFIDVADARGAIEDNITECDELASYDDVRIIFEPDSALPLYYAYEDSHGGDSYWCALDSEFNEFYCEEYDSFEELKKSLAGEENVNDDEKDTPGEKPQRDEDESEEKSSDNDEEESEEQSGDNDGDKSSQAEKETIYRVRKSAGDAESQIGAFAVLENAKNLADSYKDEGYKVYDGDGNLVYTPA